MVIQFPLFVFSKPHCQAEFMYRKRSIASISCDIEKRNHPVTPYSMVIIQRKCHHYQTKGVIIIKLKMSSSCLNQTVGRLLLFSFTHFP